VNSRERFLETMRFGQPDRVPYFEEGLRKEVLMAWQKQGLGANADLATMFLTDQREEIDLDVDSHPWPEKWPGTRQELKAYERRFDPTDRSRLPERWKKNIPAWRRREHVLMLRVHIGFFESMGVNGWGRFHELMVQLHREPDLVRDMLRIQGECVAALTERFLKEVEIDAAVFSEPIGDNHGPLISPQVYKDIVLSSYRPILDVLRRHSVEIVILRTYANARLLIPVLLEAGIDCLWACEVNAEAMDYRSLRREFGPGLRLIGGIDLDALRQDREAIRREVEEKVPLLLVQGGYVPLADGRVRADIPFENYVFYRQLLEKVTSLI
jgi:uroporphyrinogen decarboxylase